MVGILNHNLRHVIYRVFDAIPGGEKKKRVENLFKRFEKEGFIPKIAISYEEDAFLSSYFFEQNLMKNKMGLKSLFFVLIIAYSFMLSFAFGSFSAKNKRFFDITNANPECAVVFRGTDNFYCIPFNEQKKEFDTYKVLYYQDNQNFEFKRKKIGPLHLKPTPTPTPKPTLTPTITNTPLPTPIPTETFIPLP